MAYSPRNCLLKQKTILNTDPDKASREDEGVLSEAPQVLDHIQGKGVIGVVSHVTISTVSELWRRSFAVFFLWSTAHRFRTIHPLAQRCFRQSYSFLLPTNIAEAKYHSISAQNPLDSNPSAKTRCIATSCELHPSWSSTSAFIHALISFHELRHGAPASVP